MYEKIFIFISERRKEMIRKMSVITTIDSGSKSSGKKVEKNLLAMSVIICVMYLGFIVALITKMMMGLDKENLVYSYVK